MYDLAGAVVWITGAAGSLGAAAAARFAQAGARLALSDRSSGRLPATEHLRLEGVDMTDAGAVQAATDRVLERFGRIDALFHTIGAFAAGPPVHEETLDTWERMLALNLRTAVLATRAVVPHMLREGGGRIVLVAGRPALSAPAGFAPYAAAKAGVLRLSESLSSELKGSAINVNCVVPSIIDTPDNRRAMPAADRTLWVEPAAVADVALFLIAPASRAVTGAAIPVFGRG